MLFTYNASPRYLIPPNPTSNLYFNSSHQRQRPKEPISQGTNYSQLFNRITSSKNLLRSAYYFRIFQHLPVIPRTYHQRGANAQRGPCKLDEDLEPTTNAEPMGDTVSHDTRRVTWNEERAKPSTVVESAHQKRVEYINLPPIKRRSSFDNKLDSDLNQVTVLKRKTKDLTKPQPSTDIEPELEQPFWCKGCKADRQVRGRWTLCAECQCSNKWCQSCLKQENHVLVKKGSPCTICDTIDKDFPCRGCRTIHPEASIEFVEKKDTICQICTSHGVTLCLCGKNLINRKFSKATTCPQCTTKQIFSDQFFSDPGQEDTSEKTGEQSEQGVPLLSKLKQVDKTEDKTERKRRASFQSLKAQVQTGTSDWSVQSVKAQVQTSTSDLRASTKNWTVKDIVQTLCTTLNSVLLLVVIGLIIWGVKVAFSGKP